MAEKNGRAIMEEGAGTRIAYLAEYEESIPLVAAWGFQEWGHLTPGATLEGTVERFRAQTKPGMIPETLVALHGQHVIGMASLVKNDLSLRPELTPWMASVYVDTPYRGCGVGSQIVRAVLAEAAALALERLYLITHDRMTFYRRLGWTRVERVRYRGEDVTVMRYSLTEAAGEIAGCRRDR